MDNDNGGAALWLLIALIIVAGVSALVALAIVISKMG